MRIGVVTPMQTGVYKDDTTMFCEGFERLGHTVVRLALVVEGNKLCGIKPDEEALKKCDVIWAPYEPLIRIGLIFKHIYNIPLVGHWEVTPPGRVNIDIVSDHWLKSVDEPTNINYKSYRTFAEDFISCDAKTITCKTQKFYLEKLIGMNIDEDIPMKPYPIDTELLESYKSDEPHDYHILSIMRLVPHKRTHHIIKAISLLENPPKLIIAGVGPEKGNLEKLAKDLKVDVEFKGHVTDKEKCKLIQQAMFTIYPWAWLPVTEAAFYNKVSLTYFNHDTVERLGDAPLYSRNNDIPELAKKIQWYLDNPGELRIWGERANKTLKAGGCNTYSIKEAAQKMVDIFKTVVK